MPSRICLMLRSARSASRSTQAADAARRQCYGRTAVTLPSLIGCLLIAGCTPRETADDNRPGGFYGGVVGGVTRP